MNKKRIGNINNCSDASITWEIEDFMEIVKEEMLFTVCSPVFLCAGQTWYLRMSPQKDIIQFEINSHFYPRITETNIFEFKYFNGEHYRTTLFKVEGYKVSIPSAEFQTVQGSDHQRNSTNIVPHDVMTLKVTFGRFLEQNEVPSNATNTTEASFGTSGAVLQACSNLQQLQCPLINSNATNTTEAISGTSYAQWQTCSNLQQLESPSVTSDDVHERLLNFNTPILLGRVIDLILNVKGRYFKVHKNMLTSRSHVFRTMFGHGNLKRTTDYVKIDDCDPEPFNVFLHFLYTARTINLSVNTSIEVYIISQKYGVKLLADICATYMMNNMCLEYFCDVVSLAQKYSELELLKHAKIFLSMHMEEITASNKWKRFIEQYPVAGNELLRKELHK